MQSISLGAGRIKSIWYLQKNSHWLKQSCGAGAALFGRSRLKRANSEKNKNLLKNSTDIALTFSFQFYL